MLDEVPSWRAADVETHAPYRSPAVAHSTDILPTVLGMALDTKGPQECPSSEDGTRCDGRDLRAQLKTNPAGPAPASDLRHALCGHHTQRATTASRQRYLLTRPESVGRCVPSSAPACESSADCAEGAACIAGRCLAASAGSCGKTSACPVGAACIAGQCRTAPSCVNDGDCKGLLPGQEATCGAKGASYCRNAPEIGCGSADDCPVCPSVNGAALACGRVCEPKLLKLYLSIGGSPELVDLAADPDEQGRFTGPNDPAKIAIQQMSSTSGPYARTIRDMTCCIDDWWPDGARGGTLCDARSACPADLLCNQ
jgi:hypothetical protein